MRKFSVLPIAAALVFEATAASAALHSLTATLSVAIGTLPAVGLSGGAAAASSAGVGGAATLPAGSISGTFQTSVAPPFLTLLDGVAVAAPGALSTFAPAANNLLSFDGATGTMSLNASAYLLMGAAASAEIPLGVVGVGGTQMFLLGGALVAGTIFANPYQLGMLTLMGTLNGAPHTLMATGFDGRTAGGEGTLVLVSPTTIDLGPVGSLASIATLTLNIGPAIPEPGTLILLGAGIAVLAAARRRCG
jgi:hypothetical protein